MNVRDVMAALDTIAPPYLAFDKDPTGLLIGDGSASVSKVVVALDITLPVVEQAKASGAEMVIAHHPLIYNPLKTARGDDPHPGPTVLACAKAGIAVACAHTNWDVAPGGVNDVLAGLLELQNIRPLRITYREPLVKIAVFVPNDPQKDYQEILLEAMGEAGGGVIGLYDRSGFWASGTGTFRPLEGAKPYIGSVGRPEYVEEYRLEMIAPESKWRTVVQAMKAAHPYEEVAYDVYPLRNVAAEFGIGRIGELAEPMPVDAFQAQVANALHFDAIRLAGPRNGTVRTVAVCGGAGAELMPDAVAAGADILVTSDVRHHEFIEADGRGFLLMDAGHAATESPGAEELARRLATALPEISVHFVSSAHYQAK